MVKNLSTNTGSKEMDIQSLGWADPLEEEMATHSGILAWKIPWRAAWQATVHGVAKSNTTPFKFLFHSGPYFLLYIQDL